MHRFRNENAIICYTQMSLVNMKKHAYEFFQIGVGFFVKKTVHILEQITTLSELFFSKFH